MTTASRQEMSAIDKWMIWITDLTKRDSAWNNRSNGRINNSVKSRSDSGRIANAVSGKKTISVASRTRTGSRTRTSKIRANRIVMELLISNKKSSTERGRGGMKSVNGMKTNSKILDSKWSVVYKSARKNMQTEWSKLKSNFKKLSRGYRSRKSKSKRFKRWRLCTKQRSRNYRSRKTARIMRVRKVISNRNLINAWLGRLAWSSS